jgi:cytochrome c oxidase accessory protein FixG
MIEPVTPLRELPAERPASFDERGRRIFLHPAQVSGVWKQRRVILQSILLVIFLILPWIKINGYPAVLLDIPQRRFALFGMTFWAHDAPLLLLVMAIFAFSVALVTVLYGRVWCGWACPQTVFIERVFRAIETWIEGSHLKRRELDRAPWTFRKIRLRTLKWILFTTFSLVLTHSLLAYFVGVDRLEIMIQSSPREAWDTFLFMIVATAVVLFNFGWFREQFCMIMCPYGKIQSLVTDSNTMTITYDTSRGEPRRQGGDCVNCFKCVNVCPTGIDIRRGSQQLECISCTACMDICDDVMTKTKKPSGLIRYASESGRKPTFLRARPLLYSFFLVISISLLAWTVAHRTDLRIVALRANESPYQITKNEKGEELVVNHFRVDVRNQSLENYSLQLRSPESLHVKYVTALSQYEIPAGSSQIIDVFVEFDRKSSSSTRISNLAFDAVSKRRVGIEKTVLSLVGPDSL